MTEQSTMCIHHIVISHRETAQWIPHLSHGEQCANPAPKAEMKQWNRTQAESMVWGAQIGTSSLGSVTSAVTGEENGLRLAHSQWSVPTVSFLLLLQVSLHGQCYFIQPHPLPANKHTMNKSVSESCYPARCVWRLRICQLKVIKKHYLHHESSKLHQVAMIQKDPGRLHIRKISSRPVASFLAPGIVFPAPLSVHPTGAIH